ncbi:MAG: hypothetical protein IJH84_21015, partial [Saccharopolyspora sp.]|nr:hypothetical protein [Saccharopolyspora sp.]
LLPELPQSDRPLPTGRQLPDLPPLTSPPPAEHVLSVLRGQLPADAVVVTEAPTHKQTIQRFLPFDSP